MRRRILAAILSVTGIAIVLFGAPLAVIVEHLDDDAALLRLERQAVRTARKIPTDSSVRDRAIVLPTLDDQTELALYDPTGHRVTGSGPSRADRVVERALADEVADLETDRRRIVAVPIGTDGRPIGVIRAEQSTRRSNLRTLRVIGLFTGLGVGVLATGALIAFWVAERLTHPVRRLRDAAVRLGDGDFSAQMPQSPVPELQELGDALSSTARRLDDLVAKERSFSADASHQLRTPLAGLRASIETELAFPRADSTEVLREALVDIDRLSQTITELLLLARTRRDSSETVAVGDVLDDVRERWTGRFTRAARRFEVDDASAVPRVTGTAAPLRHALDVLIDNAMVHGAGRVQVAQQVGDAMVTISVCDQGTGFAPGAGTGEEPFETAGAGARSTPNAAGGHTGSDGARDAADPLTVLGTSGSGIGLALARRLVESMQGRLTIARSGPEPRVEIALQRADRDRH